MDARRSRGIAAALAVAGAMLAGAAACEAGTPVTLAHLWVRNARGLVGKVAGLAGRVAPEAGAMVTAGAAGVLDGPEWAGIDWGRPVSVALVRGSAFESPVPAVVAFLPVADAERFRQARQAAARPDETLEVRGDVAVLADKAEALRLVTPKMLEYMRGTPALAAKGDLYFTVYVARVVEECRPLIDAALGPGAGTEEAAAGPALMATDPLLKLAGSQLRRLSLAVQLGEQALEMCGRLYPLEGSPLAGLVEAQRGGTPDLDRHLPANAALALAARLDVAKLKPLLQAVLEACGPALVPPEDQAKLIAFYDPAVLTGEFAFAASGAPAHRGIQTLQLARVRDAAAFRRAAAGYLPWAMSAPSRALAPGGKSKVEHTPAARDHGGTGVDRITVSLPQTQEAEAIALMPQLPPQVAEIAAAEDVAVVTHNNADGSLIDAALDHIAGGGGNTQGHGALRVARAAAWPNANVVFQLSFSRLLGKAAEEAGRVVPMLAPALAPMVPPPGRDETPVTGCVLCSSGSVSFRVCIPWEPLIALGSRVAEAVKQKPPGGMPGAELPGEGPAEF